MAPAPEGLSSRRREVLTLLVQGYPNQEVAVELCISVRTVEAHRRHISEQLELPTRSAIVRFAKAHGLI